MAKVILNHWSKRTAATQKDCLFCQVQPEVWAGKQASAPVGGTELHTPERLPEARASGLSVLLPTRDSFFPAHPTSPLTSP